MDFPIVERGPFGPHAAKAVCPHCGAFVQWVSGKTPEERQEARQRGIGRWMAKQAPTERQLRLLKALGHGGAPANRLEASKTIDALLGKGDANDQD